MSRLNLRGSTAANFKILKELMLSKNVETLSATRALAADEPIVQWLDPGGAARDLLLPPEADADEQLFIIVNTANAAENLVVKDDSDTATILTIGQFEMGIVVCNGSAWRGMVGGVA